MFLSVLVWLGMFWYSVQLFPGVTETMGYVFGLLIAPLIFDAFFPREAN
jgi:hypothetical protein